VNTRRRKATPATRFIFIAIVIGLAIEIYTGAWKNAAILGDLGAIRAFDVIVRHEYWRLLSAMFLHGDGTPVGTGLHVAMNLFALFQLGTLYELMFGTRRFLLIYFVAGICASITSLMFMSAGGSSVGASGAIFGILGAFIFSVRRSPRWRHERSARGIVNQVAFWILANIAIGLQIPQIDNAAHIGGLVTGLLLGALLPHRIPPPPPASVVVDVMPYGEAPGADPAARTDDRSWRG
jgi:rhomboid protease GluP